MADSVYMDVVRSNVRYDATNTLSRHALVDVLCMKMSSLVVFSNQLSVPLSRYAAPSFAVSGSIVCNKLACPKSGLSVTINFVNATEKRSCLHSGRLAIRLTIGCSPYRAHKCCGLTGGFLMQKLPLQKHCIWSTNS